jgi:CO/xanthine dehydrogenase FAD-binding subunit
MKPSAFAYHGPETVEDAVGLLAEIGSDGKVLAGGQSLVPMLNMRLAAPAHLIDVNRLKSLAYVRTDEDGVRIGALARHADVERDALSYAAIPLLRQAVRNVAHPTIRNRGTTVGSLVHADPSGEMTAVLALLGGSVSLRSASGVRHVVASEFFTGPLESCTRPDELAVEAFFPKPGGRTGSDWSESARRHGDYALVGVGTLATLDDDQRIIAARAGYVSVGAVPVVIDLSKAVSGLRYDVADWSAAGDLAAAAVEPDADIHATAEYRRHLVGVLTARSLRQAALRAAGRAVGGAGED